MMPLIDGLAIRSLHVTIAVNENAKVTLVHFTRVCHDFNPLKQSAVRTSVVQFDFWVKEIK